MILKRFKWALTLFVDLVLHDNFFTKLLFSSLRKSIDEQWGGLIDEKTNSWSGGSQVWFG